MPTKLRVAELLRTWLPPPAPSSWMPASWFTSAPSLSTMLLAVPALSWTPYVWSPAASLSYWRGETHSSSAEPSNEHVNVEFFSLDENLNVAVVLSVGLSGPEVIVVWGNGVPVYPQKRGLMVPPNRWLWRPPPSR
jgi:hypothetical protein